MLNKTPGNLRIPLDYLKVSLLAWGYRDLHYLGGNEVGIPMYKNVPEYPIGPLHCLKLLALPMGDEIGIARISLAVGVVGRVTVVARLTGVVEATSGVSAILGAGSVRHTLINVCGRELHPQEQRFGGRFRRAVKE